VAVVGLWANPSEHVVVERRWKYAPPLGVMYNAIVNDHHRWLSLLTDETSPIHRPQSSPRGHVDQAVDRQAVATVELRIEPDGQ
jgi:hypothetical protein